MQPPHPRRVAGLRLPDLPPRDLERLAATAGPHSAPAPDAATYALPAPVATPTKFGGNGDGSPADVRGYASVNPLLMRGGVVSPGAGGGSGLVLPNLSLPLTGAPNAPPVSLPSVSVPLTAAAAAVAGAMAPPAAGTTSSSGATSGPLGGGGQLGPQHQRGAPPPGSNAMQTQGVLGGPPSLPRPGSRTTPSSPVTAGMTQNEIKKAQNRKSAKRFREAQKQRWKNMADDLMIQKRTIDELRAQIAAQAHANTALRAATLRCPEGKRSAVSINDLVDNDGNGGGGGGGGGGAAGFSHAEAEAALYAQILSNTANKGGGGQGQGMADPYVKELGVLSVCSVVVAGDGRIVSVRRGQRGGVGTFATEGLATSDVEEFRNALKCGRPVSMCVTRNNSRVNCVMNPVEGSDRVVVAEFTPF